MFLQSSTKGQSSRLDLFVDTQRTQNMERYPKTLSEKIVPI